jgi:hypothetical protein
MNSKASASSSASLSWVTRPKPPPRDEPFDNQFGAATWRDPSIKQFLTDR